jgi:hypothetical protein
MTQSRETAERVALASKTADTGRLQKVDREDDIECRRKETVADVAIDAVHVWW